MVQLQDKNCIVIVSKVGLLPLSQINYTQVARDIIAANSRHIPLFEMRKIWKAILKDLYVDPSEAVKEI